MRRLIIAAAFLFPQIAYAQAPVPELTLKVTALELEIIGKGLGTQPYNDVVPLMNKLRQQVMEQQKPALAPKPDEPKKD